MHPCGQILNSSLCLNSKLPPGVNRKDEFCSEDYIIQENSTTTEHVVPTIDLSEFEGLVNDLEDEVDNLKDVKSSLKQDLASQIINLENNVKNIKTEDPVKNANKTDEEGTGEPEPESEPEIPDWVILTFIVALLTGIIVTASFTYCCIKGCPKKAKKQKKKSRVAMSAPAPAPANSNPYAEME